MGTICPKCKSMNMDLCDCSRIYFNREEDGHSYFYSRNILMACPTSLDGTPDYDAFLVVDEFAEPLQEEELKTIKEELQNLLDRQDFDRSLER